MISTNSCLKRKDLTFGTCDYDAAADKMLRPRNGKKLAQEPVICFQQVTWGIITLNMTFMPLGRCCYKKIIIILMGKI